MDSIDFVSQNVEKLLGIVNDLIQLNAHQISTYIRSMTLKKYDFK